MVMVVVMVVATMMVIDGYDDKDCSVHGESEPSL